MRRRIWVYPDGDIAEVVMLGAVGEIAPMFAALKSAADRWPGWALVDQVIGGPCAVLRLQVGRDARYLDPIAEFLAMWHSPRWDSRCAPWRAVEWSTPGPIGTVGTW